jgi:hypothetical protein
MNFASQFIYYPVSADCDNEEIYYDELEDGLATAAQDQAKLWAEQAVSGNEEGLDKEFVQQLLEMSKEREKQKQATIHNDSQATHAGVFSSAMRLQPRFEVCPCLIFVMLVVLILIIIIIFLPIILLSYSSVLIVRKERPPPLIN